MLGCSTATFSDGQLPQKQRPSRHQHCRMGVCGASRPAAQNFLRLRQLWASRFVVHRPAGEFWVPVSCPTLVTTRRRCSINLAINLGVFHPRRSSSSTTISQTAPSCTLARGSSQAPNCGAPARERPATQRQVGLPHQLPQQPESILQVDSKRCAQVQSS